MNLNEQDNIIRCTVISLRRWYFYYKILLLLSYDKIYFL